MCVYVLGGGGSFSVLRPGTAVCGDTTKECVVEYPVIARAY